MLRPERPSRLDSTEPDAIRTPSSSRLASLRTGPSDVGAECDLGLGEAPPADHGGPADAVPDQAAHLVALARETLEDLALDPAAQEDGVRDDHQEEEEPDEDRVALHRGVGDEVPDQHQRGHHEEEAARVAT